MRKVFYLLTLSLIFIYGCSNEDVSSLDSSPEALKFQFSSIDGKSLNTSRASITMEDMQSKTGSKVASKSGKSGANGHFNTQEGNAVTFSSNGNWIISGNFNFKGDVICTTIEGNRAVVQVVITELGENPYTGSDLVVGNTLFYLLEDNGEGNNAPRDRYWNYSLYIDETVDFCFDVGPSFYLSFFDGCDCGAEWKDTAKKSDQIQVK